ncbi:MAG: carbohydrate-binding family 9-like protein [Dysgonomonas sp.]|nr:carbohydrate-binding family 9-like protein [Dysgonomonas sp.]
MKKYFLLLTVFTTCILTSNSQVVDEKLSHLFTTPKNYVVGYTNTPPVIDGNVEDKIWDNAAWTDVFEDIEGDLKPKPYYATRAKMLWDRNYLYIAAVLEEKHVWSYLDKRDQIVFFDNDFEVFLDPNNDGHRYFEYEINALNNMFDLFLPKPYRAGSGALISWDSNRLKHAVKVIGTLNDPTDEDKGWTVEMAIPFADVTIGNDPHVPKHGEVWRINFSRVQWETEIIEGKYVKKKGADGKNLPENNWVWSPQGVINMHLPERWGYLQFSEAEGEEQPVFVMPYSEKQKQYLWQVFYKQHEYKEKNGKYASSLKELGISDTYTIDGAMNKLSMEATSRQFSAKITGLGNSTIYINDEGLIQ